MTPILDHHEVTHIPLAASTLRDNFDRQLHAAEQSAADGRFATARALLRSALATLDQWERFYA